MSATTRPPAQQERPPLLRPNERNLAIGLVLAGLGIGVALAAAALSGATQATVIDDPGGLVRYGLVIFRVVADTAAALTIGSLLLAAVALPVTVEKVRGKAAAAGTGPAGSGPGAGKGAAQRARPKQAHRPALVLAAGAATVWAAASVVLLVLAFADALGQPLSGPDIGTQLVSFAKEVDLGRGLALTAISAAVIGLLAAGATRLRSAGLLTVAAMLTTIPTALAGHASTSASHETAVSSLGFHILGASVWVGGLAALLLLAPALPAAGLSAAIRRYSTLALWCFGFVGISGVINAWLRMDGFKGLNTTYGVLVVGKTLCLVLLGVAGYAHRGRTIPQLEAGRPRMFLRLGAVEVGVMAVAFGLASALSRTPPPAAGAPTTDLATSVTGYPLPPPDTFGHWFTIWQPDLFWVVLIALAAFGYGAGVLQLRRRGDQWPVNRAVWFAIGLLVLVYVTCGAPAAYGRVLFSGHMIMHMLLSMVVPPFLVLGAPITLALRVLTARTDGTRGAREWILAGLESRVTRTLAFAPVAAVIFVGSLVVFYETPLFRFALTTHTGHELMHVHFLLTGYLFAWVLIGVDPGPRRASYPLRLITLLATMAVHSFFFLSIMTGDSVLQPHFFGGLGRHWGRSLLADQQFGGGIGWGLGEVPIVLIVLALAIQWSQSDAREARRYDRAADRDGDAELAAYNAMLAGLAQRSRGGRGSNGTAEQAVAVPAPEPEQPPGAAVDAEATSSGSVSGPE